MHDEKNLRSAETKATHFLDYEGRVSSIGRWQLPLSGVASFLALVLSLPWMGCVFLLVWLFMSPPSWGGSINHMREVLAIGYLPVLVAFAFGCYSMKQVGLKLRNAFGVLGFILSGTIIIAEVIYFCLK